jgi:hypothetical protein
MPNFSQLYRGGAPAESEFLPRFTDLVLSGVVYSNGCSTTALSANTITLTATTTPILGSLESEYIGSERGSAPG